MGVLRGCQYHSNTYSTNNVDIVVRILKLAHIKRNTVAIGAGIRQRRENSMIRYVCHVGEHIRRYPLQHSIVQGNVFIKQGLIAYNRLKRYKNTLFWAVLISLCTAGVEVTV